MESDWIAEWTPPPPELPKLAPETLAAVRALQKGEVEESTRHLFATFEPQLVAYFERHGCEDEEAEDLAQNVFIQMLAEIGNLRDASSFHFWLFRIAHNDLRNLQRDRIGERERVEDVETMARKDREPGLFWMRGAFEPNPEAKATVDETVDRRRRVLRKLLQVARLGPQTRETLLLTLRGFSYEEIARGLGISYGTVGSHVSRACAALLRHLETTDLDDVELDDGDELGDLDPELLTFRGEALTADPVYLTAGFLESGSAEFETAEDSEELALDALIEAAGEEEGDRDDEDERVVDSAAEIAAVVRQERRRGRRRRRTIRAVPPARGRELVLPKLSRDDLGYPLILLGEAAARCNGNAAGDLALRAKLTCAGSLLARGRRFPVARQAGRLVREAIGAIPTGGRDDVLHKVEESRGLLRAYLGRH